MLNYISWLELDTLLRLTSKILDPQVSQVLVSVCATTPNSKIDALKQLSTGNRKTRRSEPQPKIFNLFLPAKIVIKYKVNSLMSIKQLKAEHLGLPLQAILSSPSSFSITRKSRTHKTLQVSPTCNKAECSLKQELQTFVSSHVGAGNINRSSTFLQPYCQRFAHIQHGLVG